MKKLILSIVSIALLIGNVIADEGMWLPNLIKKLNEGDMQKIGMKLTAEDIYSVNNSSLKDAIVQFGGGCTGELVSADGLLFTNHHCGFGQIQSHSTVEHDYLTNGFWAKNRGEELPNPGLTATFVVRIEDVTKQVLEGISDTTTEARRTLITNANMKKIEAEAIKGTKYDAKIKAYFFGNEYYMVITQTYKDVRLVGAPPTSIGKFGGDTDNWMWPRHTGDFSVFRIYANENNEPAEYSVNNKPYKAKNFLAISMAGVKQGDFTLTYGFPGRTFEYLTSYGIKQVTEISNPSNIKVREMRLAIWDEDMKHSDIVRIKYASKYAGVANYYKKFQGENKGMRILNTVQMKQDLEAQFQKWADADPKLQEKYGKLLNEFEATYTPFYEYQKEADLMNEAVFGIEIFQVALSFNNLYKLSLNEKTTDEEYKKEIENLKKSTTAFYKDYNADTDKKIFGALLKIYAEKSNVKYKSMIISSFNGSYDDWADKVFKKSIFADETKMNEFLKIENKKKFKKLIKDPAFELATALNDNFSAKVRPNYIASRNKIELLQRKWMAGLMEMQTDRKFWPDANSTLRVAFGTVEPYKPYDGAQYEISTHLKGIMEKQDNTSDEFTVPAKLAELYDKKDFGRYADASGDVPVAFIATNHTTGGNSGSPLLNSKGELLGLNFDTGWEGTMSNYHFDASRVRNISVDVRYVLFIIDKFAGAGYLLNEMKLTN